MNVGIVSARVARAWDAVIVCLERQRDGRDDLVRTAKREEDRLIDPERIREVVKSKRDLWSVENDRRC